MTVGGTEPPYGPAALLKEAPMDSYENPTSSIPFPGGARVLTAPGSAEADHQEGEGGAAWLSSPFSEGLVAASDASESEEAFAALAAELEDEEFDEALQALVDEAAGRHLDSAGAWPSGATEQLATGEVEAWMAGIASEADRLLEHVERHFADRAPESLAEGEVEAVLTEALAAQGHPGLEGEDFLGALARKVKSVAKGAVKLAKRGIAIAGGVLLGPLFGIIRKLVPLLLKRVLSFALNKLPPGLQKDAAALADKLGIRLPSAVAAVLAPASAPAATPAAPAAEPAPATEPAAEPAAAAGATLAELFDAEVAGAVAGQRPATVDEYESEWELLDPGDGREDGAVARLDAARAELVDRIAEAPPGSVLTAELEQFLPAVMAALPMIRTGIRVIGRERVVGLIAKPLAELIKGHVGPEASRRLARAIADKGLGLLSLEAEAQAGGYGRLGAEALASTLEDTIRAVGQLPPESQAEPLRLQAELQEAFAEAAARHLPSELLRADVGALELEGESAVWVLMPRGPSRRYRYRKCTRIFPVRIGRQVARAVVLADGETLEQRLLDEGGGGWPLEAEVHVYESLPGTHLGHLAAAEGEDLAGGPLDAGEFEELTPRTASLLLNQPGLGGRPAPAGTARRWYRVAVGGRPRHPRRHKRLLVRLPLTGSRPVLRLHLRLGERSSHRIGELVAQRADVRLVAGFRALILGVAQRSLPARLARQFQRTPGAALSVQQAQTVAAALGERMVAAISAQLRTLGPSLAAAARDPAAGMTLIFEFGFADRAALAAGRADAPTITVRPGRHHD
jgi:hypothetical protein